MVITPQRFTASCLSAFELLTDKATSAPIARNLEGWLYVQRIAVELMNEDSDPETLAIRLYSRCANSLPFDAPTSTKGP